MDPKRFNPHFYPHLWEKGFALHDRRYIGNKYELTDWMFSIINKECEGTSFADIFAGTGVVGAVASKHFNKIIFNDLLYSNYVIYKAFFEKGTWSQQKIGDLLNLYNNIQADMLPESDSSKYFTGKYFSNNAAKFIGFIRETIEENKDSLSEKEYHILIASLLYSADQIADTIEHDDDYVKEQDVRNSFPIKLIQQEPIKSLSVFREDSNLLVKKIKPDVVYIDPPYNSRQYNKFYDVLETLVKWDNPQLGVVALKPEPENMSDYYKQIAKDKFSELIKDIKAKYLVVSYNNIYDSKSSSSQNKINLQDIENILTKKGQTKIFEKDYRYFNTGDTDLENHKEYLFVTSVASK